MGRDLWLVTVMFMGMIDFGFCNVEFNGDYLYERFILI